MRFKKNQLLPLLVAGAFLILLILWKAKLVKTGEKSRTGQKEKLNCWCRWNMISTNPSGNLKVDGPSERPHTEARKPGLGMTSSTSHWTWAIP